MSAAPEAPATPEAAPPARPALRLPRDPGWLVLPLVLFLGVIFFWPVLGLMVTSVTDPQPGLHHYQRFFDRPIYVQVLLRTFWLASFVTGATILLGYPIAFALSTARPLAMKAMLFLIFLPFWASVMVRTYGLMVIFGRDGIVNGALMWLGLIERPVIFMFNTWMVRLAMVQIMLPFFVLPLYSVIRGIDPSLMLAARGLGARPASVFLRVYLPLSMPGVLSGALIVFILSLGFFITPALLGGRQDITISMLILSQFEAQLNWGFGATMGAIVLGVTLLAVLLLGRFTGGAMTAQR